MNDYLFETKNGRICFVIVQEEMSGIDALLTGLRESATVAVHDLNRQREAILSGEKYEHEDFGDISRDLLDSIEHCLLPDARYVEGPLCTVAESLIVFAFFERALRVVAEDVAIDPSSASQYVKKHRQMGKIIGYIEFLRQYVGLSFDVPSSVLELLEQERNLRNSFAHGEWNVAGMLPRENFVSGAFATITNLFENLEAAVEASR
ncbi:hypothetical protein R69746_08266 [Paraburkholderia aspalathi]|uniref:hypothetical protein n=1 Tax=Paraburkholderia aspalathi TaxID=1324617 RepID=UPI00190A4FF9|nr:hypothetical protein [Paraburkholderia aspalathi]MBK3844188.1 hypothetical protein [Paraburkholderia aspalathi]CAE6868681.1 hypothetical protein R69746_08266 [Paraburkholderia aspalathi]